MSKSKKLTNRIIAVLLIVLGLILGGTWNSAKYCIGDKIFIALGISPWSNGSSGTHYPAIIGSFVILAGISILNLTLQKKTRLWIWTAVILCFILFNLFCAYRLNAAKHKILCRSPQYWTSNMIQ